MQPMAANRTSQLNEATLQANWLLQRLGRELRLARIAAGLSQEAVGRRIGTSDAQVSRVERGTLRHLSVSLLYRHAAAVGLRPSIRLFPGGRRLLDAPQLSLLDRLRARLRGSWRWQLEIPMPLHGDLRAGDALLTRGDLTVLVEAITRLSDVQAQVRAAQLKRRDLAATRLLMVVAATTANRRALHEAPPLVAQAFQTDTRTVLRALAAGLDPGSDCLILL
jgi:transcriptional regulator with XRE-family HTH domain